MKDIISFINESSSEFNYAIQYAANERDILTFTYQTSLQRAQNFVRKMQKQGMLISCVYEIPSNNWEEFKKLSKSHNMTGEKLKKLKELSNEYFGKEDINKFLK